MKRLTGWMAVAILASVIMCSCSDDDEKSIALEAIAGDYVGTFDFKGEPSDINPEGVEEKDVAINVKVEGNQVILPEFPAATLVTALLGTEGAAGILPMLGKLSYSATIGKANASSSLFSAPLTTARLDIPIGPEGTPVMMVEINITSPDNMVYTDASKTLVFKLKTLKAMVGVPNDPGAAGEPFDLVNTLTFTVTKK